MSMEKKFSSVYWVDGAVMIVPEVAKGMRLYAAPPEHVQFYTPDQSDFDRVKGLKDCLSK